MPISMLLPPIEHTIILFFGLAIYMVKRSMDVEKERVSKGLDHNSTQRPATILKEKEVVTQVVNARCRNCSTLNLETNNHCENCGASL